MVKQWSFQRGHHLPSKWSMMIYQFVTQVVKSSYHYWWRKIGVIKAIINIITLFINCHLSKPL